VEVSKVLLAPEFSQRLLRIVDIEPKELDKLVDELVEHWSETLGEFVRRRHRELQNEGVPNREVYVQIARELQQRPIRADVLSVRQIRRLIYG